MVYLMFSGDIKYKPSNYQQVKTHEKMFPMKYLIL